MLPHDTEEELAARVLTFEHRLYPWVVRCLALGEISWAAGRVVWSASARRSAAEESFQLGEG